MRKIILTITFSFLIVLGGIYYYLKDQKIIKRPKTENVYTVLEHYTYLNKQDLFKVKVYSNYSDSLLNDTTKAVGYLYDKKTDYQVKINPVSAKTGFKIKVKKEILYEYEISFKLQIDELKLTDCALSLVYDTLTYDLVLGSFKLKTDLDLLPFKNLEYLTGLSFDKPFLSLGGIVLGLENKEGVDLKITGLKIDEGFKLGFEEIDYHDEILITDFLDYSYQKTRPFNEIILKKGEKKTCLISLSYLDDLRCLNVPLIIETNLGNFYINNFTYLKTNDLNRSLELLTLGVKSGV